jgi:ketosteroid isomerase-like protein
MGDIAEAGCAKLAAAYIEAWKAFDLTAVMKLHTADSVFHLHATGQSPAVGPAAVRSAFEASMAVLSDIQVEVGRLRVGDDFWVVELTMRGKLGGKTTVEMPGVDIVSVRDGLVARKDSYFDNGPVMALLAADQKSPMSQDAP